MNINIPKDKEERIFKAAIDEFTKEGYKNASTNNIVKESGISKGALFKYFGNKRNLYIYIVKRSLDVVEVAMVGAMDNLSSDLFERILEGQKIKLDIANKYPMETAVIIQCCTTHADEFEEELKERYSYYEQLGLELTTKGIDYSKFKEGVDIKKIFTTLTLISYGYTEVLERQYGGDVNLILKNYDKIADELNSYMSIIKDSVYK
ncbi:TetR/AcrR family transcriptional regulator [Clostridium sp. LP20]|uniref:TetR/AcrR family transcriptional regulator n=1 Tax=Clostridium sp. LP20 TaxID=3418665 RepID=UPI003EE6738B